MCLADFSMKTAKCCPGVNVKAGGPRNPDLCSPEVVILLGLPQN